MANPLDQRVVYGPYDTTTRDSVVVATDTEAIFAVCASQRRELSDLLEGLSESALETPSLCAGWSVRVVAAHLATALDAHLGRFLMAVIANRGSLDRANDASARRRANEQLRTLVTALRDGADKRLSPPVTGPRGPMTDLLVHGGDIRLPLGVPFDPPTEAVEIALDFLTGRAPGFVPRRRLAGLALEPTDTPRRWGTGAEITGNAADLMMAVSGRRATLDRLGGPGLPMLDSRLSPSPPS